MPAIVIHGHVRGYWRGCRCIPCRSAYSTYVRAWRRTPRRPDVWVSAEPVRALFVRWAGRGLGVAQMAASAGLSVRWVQGIRQGRVTRLRQDTVEAILAAHPSKAPHATVPVWRTRKLVKALLGEEYTLEQIARATGVAIETLRGRRARVRVETQRRVEHVYRQWMGDDEDDDSRSTG